MTEDFSIYFIDQYNFPDLCDCADKGDQLARQLVRTLTDFVDTAPEPICGMCDRHVSAPKIPAMTVVIIHAARASLTSWICEACATRDDLDDKVAGIAQAWPEISDGPKKTTLH